MSKTLDDTLDSDLEDIERRDNTRGYIYGVEADLSADVTVPVVEGSHHGMFIHLDDPENYKLREKRSIVVRHTTTKTRARCKIEIVRKQTEPNAGIGLRILSMSPDADFDWLKIIASAQKGLGEPESSD